MRLRSLRPRMMIALCALLGLLDATYLTITRYQRNTSLVCPVGGGCIIVQTSRWSTLPPGHGIPIAVIGVVGYTLLFALALVALQRDYVGRINAPRLLMVLTSGGLLAALYLTALQLFVIHAVCFWCMTSAALELAIWLAALTDWRAWRRIEVPQPMRQGAANTTTTKQTPQHVQRRL